MDDAFGSRDVGIATYPVHHERSPAYQLHEQVQRLATKLPDSHGCWWLVAPVVNY